MREMLCSRAETNRCSAPVFICIQSRGRGKRESYLIPFSLKNVLYF